MNLLQQTLLVFIATVAFVRYNRIEDGGEIWFGDWVVVITVVGAFWLTQYLVKDEEEEFQASSIDKQIDKQIDNTTVILLYILSFFIPLAGFIVGAIYASKEEEHYKHVGKNCLILSVINIILGFIMIVAILDSM